MTVYDTDVCDDGRTDYYNIIYRQCNNLFHYMLPAVSNNLFHCMPKTSIILLSHSMPITSAAVYFTLYQQLM